MMESPLEKLCMKILNELQEEALPKNGKNKIFTDLYERYEQIDEIDSNEPLFHGQIQDVVTQHKKPAIAEDFERKIQDILKDLEDEKPIEKVVEKYMEFNCPICGCRVSEDGVKCFDCGLEIVDGGDFPDEEIFWNDQEAAEISTISTAEKAMKELVKELEEFEDISLESNKGLEGKAVQFQCPLCNILVDGEDTICPGCGVRFESN